MNLRVHIYPIYSSSYLPLLQPTVRIDSNEDTLKGFIIQARDKDDKIIGYFDSDHTPNSHLTCQVNI